MSEKPAWSHAYPRLASIGLLLIAMISVQGGAALAKQLLPIVGAAGTAALRLAFATVMLLIVARPWRRLPRRDAAVAILAYGFSMGVMNLLFYSALSRIPLGITVALEFTGPLAVALAGSRRALDLAWVAFAVLGLALLLPLRSSARSLDPVGVAFALGAGFCWALYIVFGRRAGALYPDGAAALGVSAGAALIVPIGAFTAGRSLLSTALWPIAAAVALLSSAVPYSLEMFALTRLPARTFGVLMSGEPVVAALVGLRFLDERLRPTQWLAILCIMLATGGSASTAAPDLARIATD
ncbi:MAG TPA: EamA family transporter [Steroidobacteraceae bacterium]|nr:EamA family transporter [Steroidobacteraceae bacterium]